ncbi:MAG: MBL fold metallo-hydrolase, partial [Gemmatimonadota bacterium]|nr:MBL fold metallo-hydrolase [Gemmatimonadota bacterium]
MRVVSLASGSSGNAILVDAGDTRILVDCGIGPRTLAKRLKAAGVAPESVSAVVVTHEHVDHTRGIPHALKRWPWTVIGSAGTLRAVRALGPLVRDRARLARPHAQVGHLAIELVPVAHDANEPTAVAVTDGVTGIRAGIAHDLGEPSEALVRAFHGLDLLCIEANHDAGMLCSGPYPAYLKARIA